VSNEAKLQDEQLRKKFSLDVDLVAENKDDARVAELIQFSTVECKFSTFRWHRSSLDAACLVPSPCKSD